MRTSRRKTTAIRSPSSTPLYQDEVVSARGMITHHAIPPNTFLTPSLQSLIYATSNDRYPGAPGTSLHRAKVEAARAAAATKRELQKELERREEMKRLGILGVGKKRIVGGTLNGNGSVASNGGNSRYSTPPITVDRMRRGQVAATALAPAATIVAGSTTNGVHHNTSASASSSTSSTRPPRANGRTIANAIDHSSLPIPIIAATVIPGSPLLSSSGRIRRPASGSRGASPMPLTANGNGTLSSRVRSPIVAPMELEDEETLERGTEGSISAVQA